MSTNNVLSPANGSPIIVPSQDVVLGLYYMTREKRFGKGAYREGQEKEGDFTGIFASADEVRMAYDQNMVGLHSRIRYRYKGQIYDTTPNPVVLFVTAEAAPVTQSFPRRLPLPAAR